MTKVVHGGGARLPIAPLRGWLIGILRDEGLWNDARGRCYTSRDRPRSLIERCASRTVEDVCAQLGLLPRRMYSILYESQFVYLDVVDRILCRAYQPHLLRELYPALYDLPELEEAAA